MFPRLHRRALRRRVHVIKDGDERPVVLLRSHHPVDKLSRVAAVLVEKKRCSSAIDFCAKVLQVSDVLSPANPYALKPGGEKVHACSRNRRPTPAEDPATGHGPFYLGSLLKTSDGGPPNFMLFADITATTKALGMNNYTTQYHITIWRDTRIGIATHDATRSTSDSDLMPVNNMSASRYMATCPLRSKSNTEESALVAARAIGQIRG